MKILRKLLKFTMTAAIIALVISRFRNRVSDEDQDEDDGDFAWPPINLDNSSESPDDPVVEPTDGSPLEPR
jgi:hypothetical protein